MLKLIPQLINFASKNKYYFSKEIKFTFIKRDGSKRPVIAK